MASQAEEGEYEAMRAANMRRNQEIMRALGLDHSDFQLHKEHKTASAAGGKKSAPAAPVGSSRKRKSGASGEGGEDESPKTTRKSSRLSGVAPAFATVDDAEDAASAAVCVGGEEVLCELHEAAERDHLRWAGRQGKATIVGTASYRHTLHRVMTMSPAALARRINTIEKACGKYAVVKMRLFARVLCLEGHEDLSSDATAAFQRLVAKLGEPKSEGEEGEDE